MTIFKKGTEVTKVTEVTKEKGVPSVTSIQGTLFPMPPPATVIFCGTPDFAVPSLTAFLNDPRYEVVLVITQPDRPVGRSAALRPSPIKTVALEQNIPVEQPEKLNTEYRKISKLAPSSFDYLVVVAYGQILNDDVLRLPRIAAVNVHASLLPRWRGAAPIQHAILHGDTTTGVTVQQMVQELDAGPVLAQSAVQIDPQMTASELHDALAEEGADLLRETLAQPLNPQEQEGEPTFCYKLTRADGSVDPLSMTAEEIDRHVRALVPWPGVRCTIGGNEVKLLATSLEETENTLPLPCHGGTTLYITHIQSPGKHIMSGDEWKRGQK